MADSHHSWVIGDLQGCLDSLKYLLAQPALNEDPKAHFYFAGDLINRGPQSLAVLETLEALGDRAHCVLGNHDIHFLSVASGMRRANRLDSFHDILDSPQRDYWIDWLRRQPLLLEVHDHLIVHAGIDPQWSLQELRHIAREIESLLQSDDWAEHLIKLFGNEPDRWSPQLSGYDRLRYGLNVLTRIRYMHRDGRLDFAYKEAPQNAPDNLVPWFEVQPRTIRQPIVFGHWSTLGLLRNHGVMAIDTGALWGRQLTAIRLQDGVVVQVPAQES